MLLDYKFPPQQRCFLSLFLNFEISAGRLLRKTGLCYAVEQEYKTSLWVTQDYCQTSPLSQYNSCGDYKDRSVYVPSLNPPRLGRSEARTISDQDFSFSQSEQGFGKGLSNATPPVRRKRHTLSSTWFL